MQAWCSREGCPPGDPVARASRTRSAVGTFGTAACAERPDAGSGRQREVFVALVLNDVPLDALVVRLGSNRNAIYKRMFDARRKLRAALAANGYLTHHTPGRT